MMGSRKQDPSGIDRNDGLIAAGLGIVSFGLYVRTLVPGLLPGDGGEFQTLAYTLGHAHTTGYEAYSLLAKLFTLLVPIGSIAYRVNLFSAFCAGLTVAFVYLAGKVISRSRWAGVVGALALATAATFWSQSIIAEVYTAGCAIISAILLLLLLWNENGRGGYLVAAGLLGGLGLGIHGTNSLFAPAILVLILLKWRDLRKNWKPALGGAALGLALMLAAFVVVDMQPTLSSSIRAIYQPSASKWDMQPVELDSIGGRFAYLMFARQWRAAMFVDPAKVMGNNFNTYQDFVQRDFTWLLLLLGLVGLAALFIRRWRLGVFFLIAILVHAIYTLNYRIGDIYVFFISLYVYDAVLIAEGTGVLMGWLNRLPGILPRLAQPALALLLLGINILPVYGQRVEALKAGELRFDFMGLRSNHELELNQEKISYNVKALDKNAVVLMGWDELYDYFYVANVEQGRTDLQFVEANPYASKQQMAGSMVEYVKNKLAQGQPVYLAQPMNELQRGGLRLLRKTIGVSDLFLVEAR